MVEVSPQVTKPVSLANPPRWRRPLIWAGVAIVALAAAYGVGRLQTSSSIDAAEQRTTAAIEKGAETERSLLAQQRRVKHLEARRQLHLALLSLDERNFGTAQKHLSDAQALLVSHASDHPLSELVKPMAAYRLIATEDLGKQREQVLQWVRRFDVLAPPDTVR